MNVLEHNPELRLIMLTKPQFASYFPVHERLQTIGLDFEGRYRNPLRLIPFFIGLMRRKRARYIADLHGVLRSYLLDSIAIISFCRVYVVNKNRRLRKQNLTHQGISPIPGMAEEYAQVFRKLGCMLANEPYSYHPPTVVKSDQVDPVIGIAPMAKHATKQWPLAKVRQLIDLLLHEYNAHIYLLGSASEKTTLNELVMDGVTNLAGQLQVREEIDLIHSFDVLVSMDSANMHLGDLIGIPVVSIWGGTHPDMGFRPVNSNQHTLIQPEIELTCRPCSVYGMAHCKLTDTPFSCLDSISPTRVFKAIQDFIDPE